MSILASGLVLAALLAAFGVVAATAPAIAHGSSVAPCIPNELQLRGGPLVPTTEAVVDTSNSDVGGAERVAYDLTRGTLALEYCCSLAMTSVETHDRYDVVGVPPGTLVAVSIALDSQGEVYDAGGCGGSGCGGFFATSIQHGDEIREQTFAPTLFHGARAAFDMSAVLHTTIVAGEPAEIRFKLWGRRSPGGSHGARGTALVRFAVGHPKAAIVSCYGFAGPEIPAQAASWGAMKATYR